MLSATLITCVGGGKRKVEIFVLGLSTWEDSVGGRTLVGGRSGLQLGAGGQRTFNGRSVNVPGEFGGLSDRLELAQFMRVWYLLSSCVLLNLHLNTKAQRPGLPGHFARALCGSQPLHAVRIVPRQSGGHHSAAQLKTTDLLTSHPPRNATKQQH